ncbi:MAG: hypothetical protein K2Q45_00380 [Nitrosomonas sp.]|nr:hypothetical protein [Nitrosomonas sp.]
MKLLATVVLCIVTVPFIVYESLRFYTHHAECQVAHNQNALLLDNPLCSDPWQLYSHGPKQQTACDKARLENQVSVLSCAWQLMWVQGQPNRVFTMITESYWMLFGLLLPTMLFTLYLIFKMCIENTQHRREMSVKERMFLETLHYVQRPQQQPVRFYLEEQQQQEQEELNYGSGRRKKRNYVQLISQDE